MTRTVTPARSTKLKKTKIKTPNKTQPAKTKTKTIKKTKDGWEMSARDALQVDFVVSEI